MFTFAFDKYSGNLCPSLVLETDDDSIREYIKKKICDRVIRNAPCLYNMMKYDFKKFKEYLEKGYMTPTQTEEYLEDMDKFMEIFYKQIKKYKKYRLFQS